MKKVRSHLRDLTQSVVRNADYLRVQQPVASRVLATLAYGPKVLSLWARHETAIAKGLLFSRRDRGAT